MKTIREFMCSRAIRDRCLSSSAVLLYLQMDISAEGSSRVHAPIEVIANNLRRRKAKNPAPQRTAEKYLNELISGGYVAHVEGHSDIYEFTWVYRLPPGWSRTEAHPLIRSVA